MQWQKGGCALRGVATQGGAVCDSSCNAKTQSRARLGSLRALFNQLQLVIRLGQPLLSTA
jgi:hypothetical protein